MDEQIQAGQELMLEGNYYDAQDIFLAILQDDPENDEALYHLGLCHLSSDMLFEAESCFRQCLEVNPCNVDALIDLGEVELAKGDPEQAMLSFSMATSLEEDNARALISMARLQDYLGMDEAAVENFERAMALSDPMDAPGYDLALSYAKVRKYLRADIILDGLITETLRRGTQNFSADVSPGAREELMEYLSEMKEDRDRIRAMFLDEHGYAIETARFMYQAVLSLRDASTENRKSLLAEIRMLRYLGMDTSARLAQHRLHTMVGNFSGLQLSCFEFCLANLLEEEHEQATPELHDAYAEASAILA